MGGDFLGWFDARLVQRGLKIAPRGGIAHQRHGRWHGPKQVGFCVGGQVWGSFRHLHKVLQQG